VVQFVSLVGSTLVACHQLIEWRDLWAEALDTWFKTFSVGGVFERSTLEFGHCEFGICVPFSRTVTSIIGHICTGALDLFKGALDSATVSKTVSHFIPNVHTTRCELIVIDA
jgi:hypothetical protein